MTAHIASIVAKQYEKVLRLIPYRGILEAEEVANVLAGRVYHVSVFGETRWEVGRIEHVVSVG